MTDLKTIVEIATKAFIDSLHDKNERTRRDLGIDFYNDSDDLVKNNQNIDLNDNKITDIESITLHRSHISDNKVANKKYIDDSIQEGTIV